MSSTIWLATGGRPGPRCLRHRRHLILAASRCHRRSVSGVTRKDRQPRPWEQSTECGEDGPIRRPVPDPGMEMTFEDPDLVAQDQDLNVVVELASPTRHDKTKDSTQAEIEE